MSAALEISGFEKLLSALEKTPAGCLPRLKQSMTEALRLLQDELKEYPPGSAANRPRPGRGYYERGRGWWQPRRGTYRLRATSEQLAKSWGFTIREDAMGLSGSLGSTASYAAFVQGPRRRQLFKQRGWRAIDEILEAQTPAILKLFEAATEEILKNIGG